MIENVETKTFTQIWGELPGKDRGDLYRLLVAAKCCKSYQTVRNWGSGSHRPSPEVAMDKVASVVSTFLKTKTNTKTLFPNS